MDICASQSLYSSQCPGGVFSISFCPLKANINNSSLTQSTLAPLCEFNMSSIASVCSTVYTRDYPLILGSTNDIDVKTAFNNCFSNLTGYTLANASNIDYCDVQTWPYVSLSFICFIFLCDTLLLSLNTSHLGLPNTITKLHNEQTCWNIMYWTIS